MICNFFVLLILVCFPSVVQASQLQGRIYPQQQDYLLGEPIFLEIELVNNAKQPVFIDAAVGTCSVPDETEVVGASHRRRAYWPRGCYEGGGGSCGSAGIVLKEGEKVVRQILLSRSFSFDHPGKYRIMARHLIPIYADEHLSARKAFFDLASNFNVNVFQGTEAQLEAAFTRYIEALPSAEAAPEFESRQRFSARINAVDAITTMAPPFLEDTIIRLSESSIWVGKAIPALGSLNTEGTRRRLAELAENSGEFRQDAMAALVNTRNPSVLPVLERIGKDTFVDGGSRANAIWDLGLFGNSAIPFLAATLADPDENIRMAAIRGLGATANRKAVPILIDQLRKSTGYLLRDVRLSLAQLTHFAVEGNPMDVNPRPGEYQHWRKWWDEHSKAAEIFNTEHCSQPRSLP